MNPITFEGGMGQSITFGNIASGLPMVDRLANSRWNVRRTEMEKEEIKPYLPLFKQVVPVGSVAYKLPRVAAGLDHVTLSVQPKSEWDICGGLDYYLHPGVFTGVWMVSRANLTGRIHAFVVARWLVQHSLWKNLQLFTTNGLLEDDRIRSSKERIHINGL